MNIGTPDEPTVKSVREYLREFLLDPDVIDIPAPLRHLLVRGIILRTRPRKIAPNYQSIWMEEGSPLRVYTQRMTDALEQILDDIPCEVGMRYGNPSIRLGLERLKEKGVERLLLAPLFPQYAQATTVSSLKCATKELEEMNWKPEILELGHFEDDDAYIDPLVSSIETHMNDKYEEISKTVQLKGFRPGKVPKEILKRQFGKAVYGEVLDKVLKETSTQALSDNKIKPAGQPKIDLKSFGEDKDLEYIISVTELPKIDLKQLENIKADEYDVTIDSKEIDKRINDIAKNQKNFVEVDPAKVANEGDLVAFDYKATVDGNDFKGSEGKNTQLELGKDLFIKGFDKQLLKVKKNETVEVEVTLPENFPEKDLVGKKAKFVCKILSVKKSKEVVINDEFAKNLGAKDLNDLKSLLDKQINEEYKNSLGMITKKQILNQIEKFKIEENSSKNIGNVLSPLKERIANFQQKSRKDS